MSATSTVRKSNMQVKSLALFAWGFLFVTPGSIRAEEAAPDSGSSVSESGPSLEDLDQKIRILERNLEVKQEEAEKKVPETPKLTFGNDGFSLKSPEGDFLLKWRGLLQVDYRAYAGGNDTAGKRAYLGRYPNNFPNTFLLRKVRPIWEATFWKLYSIRFMPDFGGGSTALLDAYGEVNFNPSLKLRVGKFTPPLSLERIQSNADNSFAEYALTAALTPSRDLGAQLSGDFLNESYGYALGIFNGAADGASKDGDSTNHKDLYGRVFAAPFKNGNSEFFRNAGIGFSANWGESWGDSVNTNLASFRSPGQNTIFTYRTGNRDSLTVHALGEHYRLNPQGYWYFGSFGMLGEYIHASQRILVRKTQSNTLEHKAWLAAVSYVITGEQPSFKGVKPRHPLGGEGSGFGAIELTARAAGLDIDAKAFPLFADSTRSVRQAAAYAAGVNWYLSRAVKFVLDYEFVKFKGGAAAGNRDDEQTVFTRLQFNF